MRTSAQISSFLWTVQLCEIFISGLPISLSFCVISSHSVFPQQSPFPLIPPLLAIPPLLQPFWSWKPVFGRFSFLLTLFRSSSYFCLSSYFLNEQDAHVSPCRLPCCSLHVFDFVLRFKSRLCSYVILRHFVVLSGRDFFWPSTSFRHFLFVQNRTLLPILCVIGKFFVSRFPFWMPSDFVSSFAFSRNFLTPDDYRNVKLEQERLFMAGVFGYVSTWKNRNMCPWRTSDAFCNRNLFRIWRFVSFKYRFFGLSVVGLVQCNPFVHCNLQVLLEIPVNVIR